MAPSQDSDPPSGKNRHFDEDYAEQATLTDGTEVHLRLVRPTDKEHLVRGLEAMSAKSRYRRFFTNKERFTGVELAYLTEFDGEDHLAIGAERQLPDGDSQGLGVARFVRDKKRPEVAEAAVAVVDHMHRQGLGRLLFVRLVAAAAERGITRFRADVLADNQAMLQLADQLAPNEIEPEDDDVVVCTMPLPEVGATDSPHTERRHGSTYGLLSLVGRQAVRVRHLLESLGDGPKS
ncbi:MAG: GNAT family N-acetyltransferase [Deltaproteobacteria bacterium]|nr:GNAT family N-acetyltransferase [Deltaproteobacteria bacterium]